MTSPFLIRGVVEGFYGAFYTFRQRLDLIRWLGGKGFNWYIYGPKNDRSHRNRWREPYPADLMDRFADTIRAADRAGITFCYSLGPGVSIDYSSADDREAIRNKFRAFHGIGVRTFALLLDDIDKGFRHEGERAAFRSPAEAQADLCNDIRAWLKELDPACALMMCPTDYHGSAPFSPYLHELGERLHPDIDVFYTGPEICSPMIPAQETARFAEAIRRPPVIWDNYPVNDLAMQSELHLGPLEGREAELADASRGFVVNPMLQPEASKIPLATCADFLSDPTAYDPIRSWERALREAAGQDDADPLQRLGEWLLSSCLRKEGALRLRELAGSAIRSLDEGEPARESGPLRELSVYLDAVDAACYHLKTRLDNDALRNDLLPWIEVTEHWYWAAKRSILALCAMEAGEAYSETLRLVKESLAHIEAHPKRVAGNALLPLIRRVQDAAQSQRRRV